MARGAGSTWLVLASLCFLVACSSPEANRGEREQSRADINEVAIASPQTPPLRVRVTAHGTLGNGCERVGDTVQRREGRTFFVTVMKVYERPAGANCHDGITEFQKEVVLDVQGLPDGVYTVNVNGVTETFELKEEGIFAESSFGLLSAVEASVLKASPGTPGVRIGVSFTGEFGAPSPCADVLGVERVRKGNTFVLTLRVYGRIDTSCPPVPQFFREFVLLEPQTLPPGTYQVVVRASNTVTASFELRPGATYREAKVTALEVVPTELEPFDATVIVRGELQSSCEVIDGAIPLHEGSDDNEPINAFAISLVSRTSGSCDGETVPFEETIPISAYGSEYFRVGSGTYTVTVNGVTKTFVVPGA